MFVIEAAINELYLQFQANASRRDFPSAVKNLHDIFQQIPYHPSCIFHFLGNNVGRRERLILINLYKKSYPDSPIGYLLEICFHYEDGRLGHIRRTWQDVCKNAEKGFHHQPFMQVSIYDAEKGQGHTSIASMGLGQEVSAILDEQCNMDADQGGVSSNPVITDNVRAVDQHVQTEDAEPLGINGISLNGRLAGFDIPTRYYFRYGMSADALSERTAVRGMPAGRYGRVRDTGENLFRRINVNAAEVIFKKLENPEQMSDSSSRFPVGAMCLEWPFGKDRNHLNGIGIIDLLFGWNTQAHEYGVLAGKKSSDTFPTQSYPGEGLDLRDAVFSMTYRSDDLDAKDFSPVVWIHGRTGTAVYPDFSNDLAAWAVTDDATPKAFQADGEWHRLDFDLPGQSTSWTFCGSNTEEMGESMERYTYAPIQEVQRQNSSGNVCLAFVHGHDLNTPEGAIEISELGMAYRSRSLLGPGQKAELCVFPENSSGDPAQLTDGSIGDVEKCWRTAFDPDEPLELIWRLRGEAKIKSFKLHQCVLAPAKSIEIALSMDGNSFDGVWHGELVDTPEDPAAWGDIGGDRGLVRVVVLAEPVRARYLRLRINSGHRQGIVGLDAVEVFGQGLPFIPSPEAFTFSENVEGLPAGVPVYAQLVAENADGVLAGDIVEVCRPTTEVPYILSASVIERRDDKARIALRTMAMGPSAIMHMTLTSEDGDEISVPPLSIGKWTAPRDVRVNVHGLKPGLRYQGRCRAENENGVSADYRFNCVPAGHG
ncbi:MAG: hypothetical protein WD075_00745 [Rhodospirillales bacterium]